MLREQVLREWKVCQAQVFKFKAEGIGSNYVIMKKLALLGLDSYRLSMDNFSPAQGVLYNFQIANGSVTKIPTNLRSEHGVDLLVELLEVAIIKDLSTDENSSLQNYGELTPIDDSGPTIE